MKIVIELDDKKIINQVSKVAGYGDDEEFKMMVKQILIETQNQSVQIFNVEVIENAFVDKLAKEINKSLKGAEEKYGKN